MMIEDRYYICRIRQFFHKKKSFVCIYNNNNHIVIIYGKKKKNKQKKEWSVEYGCQGRWYMRRESSNECVRVRKLWILFDVMGYICLVVDEMGMCKLAVCLIYCG